MIRGFLVFLYLALFLILGLPYHVYLSIIGKKDPQKKYLKSYKLIKWAFGCEIFNGGCHIHTFGQENIPDTPCLFVSNHRSYWDILITHNTCGRPVGYVAKVEMEKFPLLNHYMRDIGCIFLDRENIKAGLKTILQGVDFIKSGHSMFIFPEGTRNHSDDMLPFKEGSLKMASRANVPVVPVAIISSDDLLEKNGGMRFKKANVGVVYGKPFYISDLEKEQQKHCAAYTQDIIRSMIAEYKDKL